MTIAVNETRATVNRAFSSDFKGKEQEVLKDQEVLKTPASGATTELLDAIGQFIQQTGAEIELSATVGPEKTTLRASQTVNTQAYLKFLSQLFQQGPGSVLSQEASKPAESSSSTT